jgi:hypothetical protein
VLHAPTARYVVVRNTNPVARPTIALSLLPMNTMTVRPHTGPSYWLRFESLAQPGRGFAFPCDSAGRVNLDALSDVALRNYLFARAVVGREFHFPRVEPAP